MHCLLRTWRFVLDHLRQRNNPKYESAFHLWIMKTELATDK